MDRRVAIVHDYLTQRGGAERVVLSLTRAFPDAPVYTSFYNAETTFPEFRDVEVRPLWIDYVSPLRRRHRLALPLLPLVFSSTRIDAEIVVCSSSGWAHGIRTRGRKVVYCHSPAKWLYRPHDYLGARPLLGARVALRALAPYLRRFDRKAALNAHTYIANSTFIASKIEEIYGFAAAVLHPPPGLDPDGATQRVMGLDDGFVLSVARLLPYKNVSHVIDAFRTLPHLSLVVVGDGPQQARLSSRLPGNVRLLGEVDDDVLRWLFAHSSGLVAASREDFGLTPVEAASFGKPAAVLHWGGFLDTVTADTGVFFSEPSPSVIAAAVDQLLERTWDENRIRDHASKFSEARFIDQIRKLTEIPETHIEWE